MARLLGKEYHEHSNTWYFKEAVTPLERHDLFVKKFLDENGQVVLKFIARPQQKKLFPPRLTVFYNLQDQQEVSHDCPLCPGDPHCSHYLSVLQYAYNYMNTDEIANLDVQVYRRQHLKFDLERQSSLLNGRILVMGLYDANNDKIRFYFTGYKGLNIRLIAYYAMHKTLPEADKNIMGSIKSQYNDLNREERELFKKLQKNKCSFSNKSRFFSVHREFTNRFFPLIRGLKNVYVRETGDRLVFSPDSAALTFTVLPQRGGGYLLTTAHRQEISAVFYGPTTYLLKKNTIYSVPLPFNRGVCEQIFREGLSLKQEDVLYYSVVVARQLSLVECYLDIDEEIKLPKVYDQPPEVIFSLEKKDGSVWVNGVLRYEDRFLPMSLIYLNGDLLHILAKPNQGWYYVAPTMRHQIKEFVKQLPAGGKLVNTAPATMTYSSPEEIDELKKAFFEFTPPDWTIELTPELKNEFVYRVNLEPEITTRSGKSIDWFEYEIKYRYKDVTFTHEELRKFLRTGEKFLKLQDGRLLFFANTETFDQLDSFLTRSDKHKADVYQASLYNVPYLYRLAEENRSIRILGSEFLDQMYESLLNRQLDNKPAVPTGLRPVLRSYQRSGFDWLKMLQYYKLGGILADDMGLGKTLQALTLLAELPADSLTLVICPKTLLFNWALEIEKFTPSLSCLIYEGGKETRQEFLKNLRVNVVLASYSIIQNDLDALAGINWDYIILDEAQHIKNASALRSKAVKNLRSRWRLALTGTPMENNPMEIWSIFDFLMPGYLPSAKKFKNEYLTPLAEKSLAHETLARLFSPFILRRKKHDVLIELPDKQEQAIYCPLTPVQEKMYLQVLEAVKSELLPNLHTGDAPTGYIHILAALTRLRQICCHPSLLERSLKEDPELSGKTELLRELLEEAVGNGKKILVFSQFVEMLKVMRKMLTKLRIPYEYMDGSTTNRRQHVENFNNNDKIRVFLISLKTGGFGLNLTAADTVILVDPWWNPMGENQAVDRAHRLGQTKKVMVYKLIARGTIEEKIILLQKNKKEMFEYLIEQGQGLLARMETEEIRDLFEYRSQHE